jgi:hypothetical protein
MNAVSLLTALLWLITLMCGVAAVVAFARALRLWSRGVRLEGRVVAHAEDTDSANVIGVVEYVVAGIAYRVQMNMVVAPERLPLGTPKSVLYLESNPAMGRVATGLDLFVSTIALSIAAGVMGAIAGGLTYLGAFG